MQKRPSWGRFGPYDVDLELSMGIVEHARTLLLGNPCDRIMLGRDLTASGSRGEQDRSKVHPFGGWGFHPKWLRSQEIAVSAPDTGLEVKGISGKNSTHARSCPP